nr:tetratricopeptide repeat protein [Acinetobacter rudis]
MRYFSSRFNNMAIKRYSTTLLLVGGMTSAAHSRATEQIYHIQSNNDAILQSMVAEFALANGDIPTALHNYTVLAIRGNSTSIKQRALNIAIEQENLQSALDIARHWVVQEPKDVPAKFYLAHIALKAHEYELAAQTLNSILTIDPNADLEKILAGIMPDSEVDRNNLLNTLKASQKKDNPSILVLIAGLEAQNGHLEQALQSVNKALRKRPKVTSFILFKANLLTALGDQDETEQWYAKSSRKNSRNLEVRLAEVRFLIKREKPEEALDKLQKIILIWPDSDEALFIAGLTAIDLKDYELAEKYLIELRDSDQYQNEAYYYLAINAERKQQLETAKAYYRLVDGNLYTVSRRNLISIYAHQERLNDALRFLTQERVNYPQHANFLYLAQAEILKKMGHKQAALSLLSEAVENLPDDPEILYAQILLLDPFEDRKHLDQALKKLLELEPNSPTYLNAYAYTLALQNRRLDEARSYAERALNNAPEQASILDTLGYITFLQNDFDTAAKVLAQAYKLNPSLNIGIRYAKSLYMQGSLGEFNVVLQQLNENYKHDPQLAQLDLLVLPHKQKKS